MAQGKPRLLVTRQVFPEVLEALSQRFELDTNQDDAIWSRETLLERVRDKDALYVVTSDRVDAQLLTDCASGRDKFFHQPSAEQLSGVYAAIIRTFDPCAGRHRWGVPWP